MFKRCFVRFAPIQTFKYAASDMDGTLLSPQHTLSDYAKETLRQLSVKQKSIFMFNTGRMHADVKIVNDNLQTYFKLKAGEEAKSKGTNSDDADDLKGVRMFMSTSNGAVVHDAMTGKVLIENVIPSEIAYELYNLVIPKNETRINCNLNQRDVWYCRYNWEEVLQFHKESGLQFLVCPDTAPLKTSEELERVKKDTTVTTTIKDGDFEGVVKVFFTCWDRPLLEKLEAFLQERYKGKLTINISASYCIDIQANGIHKGRAIRDIFKHVIREENEGKSALSEDNTWLEQEVEKRLKETVAFGDDLNDAAMLTQVGQGFVMENANPKLKETYPELPVIESNANDGVAKKIREIFNILL